MIRIHSPATEADWREAGALVGELEAWDLEQSKALGLDADEVLGLFYPDDKDELRRRTAPPGGRFFLARDAGQPAGCVAYVRLGADACELLHFYVSPAFRGRGVGALLLQRLLADAEAAGYRAMRLETATFMRHAHVLYQAHGFRVREAYREVPPRFASVTIWMERPLGA